MKRVVVAGLLLTACSEGRDERPAARALLGLDPSVPVHLVSVAGWGGREQAVPDTVIIEEGAAVVFQVADFRVHTVSFPLDGLSPPRADFIRTASGSSSPPLAERGSRYLVLFSRAPPGTYPFRVDGFGEPASGAVVVTAPES